MDVFTGAPTFPYLPTLLRLALTLALGLFVGLERERRGKEAGLRTFGFAALLGGLGGLLGEPYALVGLGLLGILIVFLNWATLREGEGLELTTSAAEAAPSVRLASPFSLQAALKFGLIFLLLQVAGTLAQRVLGEVGFYAVSLVAGLVSSASGVAAAAALAAHGTITGQVAGVGVVLNSLASTAIKLPLVARISGDRGLTLRVALALGVVMALGPGAIFIPVSAVPPVAAGG